MTLYESCIAKANEIAKVRPNCGARLIRLIDRAFASGKPFSILEGLRTRARHLVLFTQGRTLADITSLYASKALSAQDYSDLKAIYEQGKNRTGKQVTWTMASQHLVGKAVDIDPVVNTNVEVAKAKRLALEEIAKIGVQFGVYRPAATMAMGDYGHFEMYDLPLPPPTPKVAERLADRLKQLQNRQASSPQSNAGTSQ